MSVSFSIDDVPRATGPLPTRSLGEVLGDEVLGEVLAVGGDAEMPVVVHGPTHALIGAVHPLIGAVHLAFAEHRPLVLCPDVVWLTIIQGLAQHVRLNAEALRPRLVRHAGTKRLTVQWDGPMPEDADSWTQIVGRFRERVAAEIGDGRARLLECAFSTTTEVERTASQIVLMDAYSPYFDFEMLCVCGIPEVRLLGTPEDWRTIRTRVDLLDELDLTFWTRSLKPICDAFVSAAEGHPDRSFWRRIYKPKDAYGGDVATGWIARLYPYLISGGSVGVPNPLLELSIKEPKSVGESETFYTGPGVSLSSIAATTSQARVKVVDQVSSATRHVTLEAGVLAVAQEDSLWLRPIVSWVLKDGAAAIMGEVVERIVREHDHTAVNEPDPWLSGPAELIELYTTIDGASLFGESHRWRLRAYRELEAVRFKSSVDQDEHHVIRFLDLPDATFIGYGEMAPQSRLVRARADLLEPAASPGGDLDVLPGIRESAQPSDAVQVLKVSLSELLDAALRAEGAVDLDALVASRGIPSCA